MSTIAITGSSGFVGRQIMRCFLEKGHKILAIVRDAERFESSQNIKYLETENLFKEPADNLQKLLLDAEILVHCAWYVEPGKYLTSLLNLECLNGTIELAQAFAASGGKRFIGIGTCFEYDLSHGMLRTDTPLKPNTLYAACKASAFQILSQLLPSMGVEFAWCRLFYLYGEGEDHRRLVPYIHQQLSTEKVAELTSGNQIRDYLDVSQAGLMITEEALSSYQGAINICSGIPITVRQLAENIANNLGKKHLLRFGVRPDNLVDPPCVVGVREKK